MKVSIWGKILKTTDLALGKFNMAHHSVVNGLDRMLCSSGVSLQFKRMTTNITRCHHSGQQLINKDNAVASLIFISALCLSASLCGLDTIRFLRIKVKNNDNHLQFLGAEQIDSQISLCYFDKMNQLAAGHHRGILIPSADKSRWKDKLCPQQSWCNDGNH